MSYGNECTALLVKEAYDAGAKDATEGKRPRVFHARSAIQEAYMIAYERKAKFSALNLMNVDEQFNKMFGVNL